MATPTIGENARNKNLTGFSAAVNELAVLTASQGHMFREAGMRVWERVTKAIEGANEKKRDQRLRELRARETAYNLAIKSMPSKGGSHVFAHTDEHLAGMAKALVEHYADFEALKSRTFLDAWIDMEVERLTEHGEPKCSVDEIRADAWSLLDPDEPNAIATPAFFLAMEMSRILSDPDQVQSGEYWFEAAVLILLFEWPDISSEDLGLGCTLPWREWESESAACFGDRAGLRHYLGCGLPSGDTDQEKLWGRYREFCIRTSMRVAALCELALQSSRNVNGLDTPKDHLVGPIGETDLDSLQAIPSLTDPLAIWVDLKTAKEMEGLTADTLSNYRALGKRADDKCSGIDRDGRKWRKPNLHAQTKYLRSSLKKG